MRSVRLLALSAGVVGSLAASLAVAPNATAYSGGTHTNVIGTAAVAESQHSSDEVGTPNVAALNGYCTYARSAVGLEGEGVDFHVAGAATTSGTYQGIPIVATGVECELIKPDMTIKSGPEYLPGAVATTNRSQSSLDARGGLICVRVWALLRQPTPSGQSLVSTARTCH